MKNQNKISSILKILLEIMAGVIIGIGVYGCKKKEPIEDTSSIEAVGQEPSTENVSSDDNLYRQSQETAFEGEEARTADGIPIIMDTEIILRIAKSQQSFSADNTLEEVEGQLVSRIRNTNNYVIGTHYFYDFINGEQPEIKFGRIQYENVDEMQTTLKQAVTEAGFINSETSETKVNQIQDEMLTRLQQYVSDDGLGIEIEQVVIKQIKFSEAVRKSLENRK